MSAPAWLDGVRLAWGTLTAVPGPPPSTVDSRVARAAMLGAWLIVTPLSLFVAGVGGALTALGVPALASGLLTVGLLQLLTNGIHADGLADTLDGLGSGRRPERSLEIMRRGDVGPLGATGLVIVLGTQGVLLGELMILPHGWLLAGLALAAGRLATVFGCARGVPAARADGLGQAMAGSVPRAAGAVSWLLAAVLGTGLTWLVGTLTPESIAWWSWPAGMVIGSAGVIWVLRTAVRRLGGITGDILGALVEAMVLGVLLGLALG
ncbi:MAG: adenosylcobinamide-GDP ribazoletransferase [Propioniciclava sp.]|uniref:adenosylcobinamide-GDP ribazoletransferase n=1 Tax=Propioniciclava sp. TaxID=2038686 RepID=UPI0039E706AC